MAKAPTKPKPRVTLRYRRPPPDVPDPDGLEAALDRLLAAMRSDVPEQDATELLLDVCRSAGATDPDYFALLTDDRRFALERAREWEAARARAERAAERPLVERGRKFHHPGPGHPSGRDALVELLERGLKSGDLEAITEDAIADYLGSRVGLGVVVKVADTGVARKIAGHYVVKDDEKTRLRHPRTGRLDRQIIWTTRAGRTSTTWVSALRKLLHALQKTLRSRSKAPRSPRPVG